MNKIDGINGLAPAARSGAVAAPARGAAKESVEAAAATGALHLSPDALQMQGLHAQASSASGFDAGRVEAVRQALADGSYRVDSQAIAARLMSLDPQLPK